MNDVIQIGAFYDPTIMILCLKPYLLVSQNNQPSSLNDVIYECSQKIQLLELNFFLRKM